MKKTLFPIVIMICAVFCSVFAPVAAHAEAESAAVPVYANQLRNGSYEIYVESSSSMFRVAKCVLTVQDGQMSVTMTMGGKGYGFVYPGTPEAAAQAPKEEHIPFVLDGEGKKTFTMQIAALNMDTDCAAWSIKKEKWSDRVLVFRADNLPAGAYKAADIKDGSYKMDVTLTGGSGRASIESPAAITARSGLLTATVVWSSPNYEYMLINGVRFDPIQQDGNSTFEIPVVADEDMAVSALTVAMSEPHLVEYTLHFDGNTLKSQSNILLPVLIAAIVLIAAAAAVILLLRKKKGNPA